MLHLNLDIEIHMITNKTLIIVVSQSGETADTLAVLRDGTKTRS